MKVVICGDRSIDDRNMKLVEEAVIASGFNISEVISGGAKGGDRLGEKWALKFGVPFSKMIPAWDDLDAPEAIIKVGQYGEYNARAGFDRNQQMVDAADAVIALQPDGESNGTQDTIDRAMKKGIAVFIYPNARFVVDGYCYEF